MQASLRNDAGRPPVTLSHQAIFDPARVRPDLGIAQDAWKAFGQRTGLMAARRLTDVERDARLLELFEHFMPYGQTYSPEQVFKSKACQRIVDVFQGEQMGVGQDALNGTVRGLLHATTQYIDDEKGRPRDTRPEAAWFRPGARFRNTPSDRPGNWRPEPRRTPAGATRPGFSNSAWLPFRTARSSRHHQPPP